MVLRGHLEDDVRWLLERRPAAVFLTVTGALAAGVVQEPRAIDEMPGLYADALRYTAFAISLQHKFFSDDNGRGFPKSAVGRQYHEAAKKVFFKKPMDRADQHLSVLRALHVLAHGVDRHLVLTDLLSLPGTAAWRAPCSEATYGLPRLEERADEIAELGK